MSKGKKRKGSIIDILGTTHISTPLFEEIEWLRQHVVRKEKQQKTEFPANKMLTVKLRLYTTEKKHTETVLKACRELILLYVKNDSF